MSVIYEVTMYIDADIVDEFDAWLEEHIQEMHELPGFVSTEKFQLKMDQKSPRQVGRIVHFRLENREIYDNYIQNHAEGMQARGLNRFSGRISISRRILIPA